MNKHLNSMVTGTIVGMAVGVMVLPQLNKKTQRNVKKVGNRIADMAEESYCNMMDKIK